MTRIVHFSDWHWGWQVLPAADLYICSGDMYANYDWNPVREHLLQSQAADEVASQVPAIFAASPNAPLVCVRGNHDFAPLKPLFAQCNLVHEFVDNEVIDVLGLKITGHRGVPAINGVWADEASRADLADRMRAMPSADVYVTHYPPSGILDSSIPLDLDQRGAQHFGLEGMGDFLLYRAQRALHCFGHIHECGGHVVKHGDVTFSNAACRVNVIEVPNG